MSVDFCLLRTGESHADMDKTTPSSPGLYQRCHLRCWVHTTVQGYFKLNHWTITQHEAMCVTSVPMWK